MIEILSIHLENFRAFGEANFTPATQGHGITAINGPNGAGKSSIISGALWALYAITPDGVPVKSLRKQGTKDDVDGPVVARVEFTHDNQTIVVERALRGKNDTTMARILVDGLEQTNVSSRTATDWVARRLGLDAEAFLTAFVVRQKELDSLVKARPADRRRTIERLAGIERMAKAVEVARRVSRDKQTTLNALPEPECDLETAQSKLDDAVKRQQELEVITLEVDASAKMLKEKAVEAQAKLVEAENLVVLIQEDEKAKVVAENEYNTVKSEFSRVTTLVENAGSVVEHENTVDSLEEQLERLNNSERDALELLRSHQDLRAELQSNEEALTFEKEDHVKAQKSLANLRAQLEALPAGEVFEQRRFEILSKFDESRQQAGAAIADIARITQAIESLQSHSGGDCPTCKTHLDDPKVLIKDLKNEKSQREDDKKSIESFQIVLESQLRENDELVGKFNHLTERVATGVEYVELCEYRLDGLTENIKESKEELKLATKTVQEAEVLTENSSAEKNRLTVSLRESRKLLGAAEAVAMEASRLPELESMVLEAKAVLSEINISLADLESQWDDVSIQDVKQSAIEAQQLAEEKALAATEAKGELKWQNYAASEAELKLKRVVTAVEGRRNAAAEVERTSSSAQALDDFRKERIARLSPELSEAASDIVARITEGKFTSVELDEDFTPIVTTATGEVRPSSWLSGGEESAVALALRIAVGEVLAGKRGGALILDEALTAQDDTRRAATMSAIRELPRQVIVINHVSEATDMVDHVATVKIGENGSEIIMERDGTGIAHEVTDEMISSGDDGEEFAIEASSVVNLVEENPDELF